MWTRHPRPEFYTGLLFRPGDMYWASSQAGCRCGRRAESLTKGRLPQAAGLAAGPTAHLGLETQHVLYSGVRAARWAGRPKEEEIGDLRPEGCEPGATVASGQRARTMALRRACAHHMLGLSRPVNDGGETGSRQRACCILGSALRERRNHWAVQAGVTGSDLTS